MESEGASPRVYHNSEQHDEKAARPLRSYAYYTGETDKLQC